MADDKSGREKQARDVENRQRERDVRTELERGDETEPPVDRQELDDLESGLESVAFPATGTEIVAAVGDHELGAIHGSYSVVDLVPDTNVETFDSPAAVRTRVHRPTVAVAMKRIVEAAEALPKTIRRGTPWDVYEKTFQELQAIEADDEDEGIRVVSEWILERIRADTQLPSSRAVRRRAATFCRENGYEIRSDDWLGI